MEFPARKQELLGRLESNGVPGSVMGQVRKRLPEGEYRGPRTSCRPCDGDVSRSGAQGSAVPPASPAAAVVSGLPRANLPKRQNPKFAKPTFQAVRCITLPQAGVRCRPIADRNSTEAEEHRLASRLDGPGGAEYPS